MKTLQMTFCGSYVAVAWLALGASMAFAAPPEGEDQEDATVYVESGEFGYRSNELQGEFVGRPMYVLVDGKRTQFWGARAMRLDASSPLRKLGLAEGDVLMRLDDNQLDIDKFKDGGIWQMPELDLHYGPTEVRWIKQGMQRIHLGQIEIDTSQAEEPTVLGAQFEISLLPGFSHQRRQGIDSIVGVLVGKDGHRVDYEVGRYYPPGEPRTGGAFVNRALKMAEPMAIDKGIRLKSQTVGGLDFDVAQGDDRLWISVASGKWGINFGCSAKTPKEVADALLMALSLRVQRQ